MWKADAANGVARMNPRALQILVRGKQIHGNRRHESIGWRDDRQDTDVGGGMLLPQGLAVLTYRNLHWCLLVAAIGRLLMEDDRDLVGLGPAQCVFGGDQQELRGLGVTGLRPAEHEGRPGGISIGHFDGGQHELRVEIAWLGQGFAAEDEEQHEKQPDAAFLHDRDRHRGRDPLCGAGTSLPCARVNMPWLRWFLIPRPWQIACDRASPA